MLHVLTFWLKRFVDWLRGLPCSFDCNGSRENYYVCFKHLIAYLNLTAVFFIVLVQYFYFVDTAGL